MLLWSFLGTTRSNIPPTNLRTSLALLLPPHNLLHCPCPIPIKNPLRPRQKVLCWQQVNLLLSFYLEFGEEVLLAGSGVAWEGRGRGEGRIVRVEAVALANA